MKNFAILSISLLIIICIYFLLSKNKVDCLNIVSSSNINNCINKEIKVKGKLDCTIGSSKIPGFIDFNDKSKLQILNEFDHCGEYSGKYVEIIGILHKCESAVSCIGIGVEVINSPALIE